MESVISVSLNGNAYQIEEAGHATLRAYLERASAQLKGNPDQAEILADLEQAIADKCQRVLGPHKTVVTAVEIAQVLDEMGPVDGAASESAGASATAEHKGTQASADAGTPKRLYQIRDGAMISGVCQGLAAYLHVDVTIIRVAFVALALFTKGLGLVVYGVLMFVIPYAKTSEEHAAAHGAPFNAKEVIDQAKRNYAHFGSGKDWRRHIRQQRRHMRRQIRHARQHAHTWSFGVPPSADGGSVVSPVLNLLSAAWLFALILAIVSLFRTGGIFGWPIPAGVPLWAAAGALIVVYQFIAAPLSMTRGAARSDGLVSLVALAILGWFLYEHVPAFHVLVDRGLAHLEALRLDR